MTPQALLDEILKLPPADRLELLERVWSSLAADPGGVPVPAWHRAELDRRLAEPDPDLLTWDEVRARFLPDR